MERSQLLPVIVLVAMILFAGCSMVADDTGDGAPAVDTETDTPSEFEANGTLAVHNINVGQSAGTLVVGPTGETMLIDTGHFNDDGEHVISYLQQHDIDQVDYLVTTHNDADHIGGNAAVIEYLETEGDGVGAVYDPGIAASTNTYGEYLDAVEQYDVTLYETREGDSIPFEDVDVEVLGPPDPYLNGEDRNENSIVLQFEYGQTSFLYTGDAEENQEGYLVEEYGSALNSTVYKAGHHGSSSSSSGELLDAVDPRVAVISSAYDSQYGHPHDEVLQKLADRSIETYWTATHGDVVFVSNGEGISIRTQQAAPTNALSLYDGESIAPGDEGSVSERNRIGTGPIEDSSDTAGETDGDADDSTSGELSIETIHADAEGDDRENLNDEYIVFANTGDESLALGGWTVEDEAGKIYTFPAGFTLEPGATVTVRTGTGTDTDTDLYWGAGSPVWNNGGDTVIVTAGDGERVMTESYS
ncbi:lamin tail domain-containing protein [Halovenus marina]|uniref:lamin tail domain-containing protein n=1 Tax=Halovenus marina TaxID=3396621 RepID=UPI003F56E60D